MPTATRDQRITLLTRLGELEISGESLEEVDATYAPDFRLHGPGGLETDYAGRGGYLHAIRAAFDDRIIRRGLVVAEGDLIAIQTWIEGSFMRELTRSPVGPLPPTGLRARLDLMSIIRFDAEGRVAEEWLSVDQPALMRQLGAT